MSELVTVNADQSLKLNAEMLASVRINGGSYNAFEKGEKLIISYTGRDEESFGRKLPILNVSGRMINAERLGNFILDDENLEVENKDTTEECIKFGSKPKYLVEYLREGHDLPHKLIVTQRIASGATQDYLREDDERTELVKAAYAEQGITIEGKENFPLMRYVKSRNRFYVPKHVCVELLENDEESLAEDTTATKQAPKTDEAPAKSAK